ncbi:glyoxalase [Flavihumibacter fluvii]|uniref:glyoxalase n=1 Tax=Flavihumibacter fluvii TaxID=2838157 RepID=UPI001BDF5D34|nr:glyoxalase [Flavihumibacter fluvii]ULQ53205.1 glyoxalase [Flavihumibacter fluvii]
MKHHAVSIRPFIGAKDFDLSRQFYQDLGFQENILNKNLSVFKTGQLAFYLQDAYVQDWVDNTMVFLEVPDLAIYWKELLALNLAAKYKNIKQTPIKEQPWGKECFMHDPSGILWIFGEFNT